MSPGVGWARQPRRDCVVPSDRGPKRSPAVLSAAWPRRPLVLHLAGYGDQGAKTPPGGELAWPRRRPAGSGEGLGLLSGLRSPGRSRPAAAGGARSSGDAGEQAESGAHRAGARAAGGFPARPLRPPAQRGGGAVTPRGAAEGRRERSAGERRAGKGLAGPRLRQSAGADAGGGSAALGYQRAGRGAPGARPCRRCAPGRPAAPARSRLSPARPLRASLLAPVSPVRRPSRSLTARRAAALSPAQHPAWPNRSTALWIGSLASWPG